MAADRKTGPFAQLLRPVANLINPDAAHFETPRNRARSLTAIQCPQHALTQILRIRLHPTPPTSAPDREPDKPRRGSLRDATQSSSVSHRDPVPTTRAHANPANQLVGGWAL